MTENPNIDDELQLAQRILDLTSIIQENTSKIEQLTDHLNELSSNQGPGVRGKIWDSIGNVAVWFT